jgi:hypothetical protein
MNYENLMLALKDLLDLYCDLLKDNNMLVSKINTAIEYIETHYYDTGINNDLKKFSTAELLEILKYNGE